ncbi:MAG: DUF2061 domain-containing protein [Deltaproteobacteria bacterium]|nr:DUF2061 domain-containing protein [Deltaproteobacteria bacterium]
MAAGRLVTTLAVAWSITGQIQLAAAISVIDTAIKIAMFYAHERAWNHIDFGRRPLPIDYQI